MKTIKIFGLFIMGLIAYASKAAIIYPIDTSQSTIEWHARKVLGQHHGTLKLKSGYLLFNGEHLSGGSFEIDMNSLADLDLTDKESNEQLVSELKSSKFFETDKYPIAKFTIKKVIFRSPHRLTIAGNLVIKGITKPISFLAVVKKSKDLVAASAKQVLVDRTQYNIKYHSKSFYAKLGDKAIYNKFSLSIDLLARGPMASAP